VVLGDSQPTQFILCVTQAFPPGLSMRAVAGLSHCVSSLEIKSTNLNRENSSMIGRSGLRKAKTYGKRCSGYPKENTALFAVSSPSAQNASATAKASTADTGDLISPSAPSELPTRQPFSDVTNCFDALRLDDQEARVKSKAKGKGKAVEGPREPRVTRSTTSGQAGSKKANEKYKWLEPLTTVYSREGRSELTIQKWQDVLHDDWFMEKIAESSYAEVFKIINNQGSSVLKLMALKPPTGRGSRRETAVTPDSIVSEVFIMDLMADIPGFLEFKEAWIIEGQPPKQIIMAFEKFEAAKTSEFTHPMKYPKDQVFVALELGDAGIDVENFRIFRLSQIWDIFLKTVVALAVGEREYLFEVSLNSSVGIPFMLTALQHRDLHEGNVCVKQTGEVKDFDSSQTHKFGYSGLEVTLLDYTLSRAQDRLGFVAYRNLEEDSALFDSSLTLQSQIYQR
jgi:Haspin like kinase domain